MAPSVAEIVSDVTDQIHEKLPSASLGDTNSGSEVKAEQGTAPAVQPPSVETQRKEPLKLSGALDHFESFDVTPTIGREFVGVNLAKWLKAPNSDDLVRDLAITISQRGVVFFRKQDDITNDLQKELVQRLGELSGKPSTSKLHIHPISNSGRELGGKDDEISVISSEQAKKIYKDRLLFQSEKKQSGKEGWHSDITFEPIPSDYALLRLTQLPKTGGDTLWASGYEVYDRISAPVQRFLEGLTATYAQPGFNEAASKNGFKLYSEQRGAPENVGEVLEAVHPVIRTNPVTGWKSVFAVGHHVSHINGLTKEESKGLLDWFVRLVVDNHDLQVRHRWQNVNDLAIWDNRSVYHVATPDYIDLGLGERTGQRAVSLGERPYFDPLSTGRREALAKVEKV
ncbi:putative alpha-ketoglutarate-dependent taurine dioxygenase [Lepidopterella palustris CBS 459.81]|uniref:Putative alpha-ketoglutarate-dependent taurine dioxygenase n=1 Tax=Lepidopterella palustris CBS 459.81 TaxID=1314670 RepID=A0A8E2E9N0_9PEZI|nr:putative alpha-ketoglutarate-dependent taurine dioxygenase [Lepidopterella palustris CBS 459.81]